MNDNTMFRSSFVSFILIKVRDTGVNYSLHKLNLLIYIILGIVSFQYDFYSSKDMDLIIHEMIYEHLLISY